MEIYPRRRWFLKVDADSLIVPTNLLRFLRFLDHEVDGVASTPIYFGSHQGAVACQDVSSVCRSNVFKRGAGPNGGRHKTTWLRDTKHWQALEREFLGSESDEQEDRWNARNRTHAVTYAWGGAYGMSRAAAERMVRTSCVWKVGTLPCYGHGLGNGCTYNQHNVSHAGYQCSDAPPPQHPSSTRTDDSTIDSHRRRGQIGLNTREDAAVGLCMHLVAAQFITCPCFHSGRVDRVWGVVPWIVSHAVGKIMVNGTFLPGISHDERIRRIQRTFHDYVPAGREPSGSTFLCRHPIALHAIRSPEKEYLPLWEMLTTREEDFGKHLEAWRQNASASRSSISSHVPKN